MSIKSNVQNTKAILMGAGNFPKDKELLTLENVATNIKELSRVFADKRILGLFSNNIISLYNTPDNTKIKEELAIAAESASDTLIFYYSGQVVLRRGQLYLTTVNSSKQQVHVNALSFAELANIIRENENATKIIILDCAYQIADANLVTSNIQQLVKEEFTKLEDALKTAYIIAASPDTTAENFKSESPSAFTNHFVKLLETGSRKETDELTLNDIFEGISEKMKTANQLLPVRGEKAAERNRGFVNNLKFVEYKKFKSEGDTFFGKESFGEALPLYQYAAKLYNSDSDLNNKIDFINFVSEANKHFSKLNYEGARQNYLYAYQLFPIQSIKSKIDASAERLAEEYFRNEQFEKAKETYHFLLKSFPDNEIFKERLEKCEDEILLAELIDEADKLFFQDRYEEAGELYQKAIEIYPDRRTVRRKEECDFLLSKEKTLRERLELELAHKQNVDVKSIVNEEVAKREQNLRKVLEVKLRVQVQQDVMEELEKQVWAKIKEKNTLDFYEFYMEIFPNGTFVEEAKTQKLSVPVAIVKEEPQRPIESKIEIKEELTFNVEELIGNIPVVDTPKVEVSIFEIPQEESKEETPMIADDRFGLFDDLLGDENDAVIVKKEESKSNVFEIPAFEIPTFEMPYTNGSAKVSSPIVETQKVVINDVSTQQPTSEEDLWEMAVSKNTIESYMYYIEQTIESAHIADAYYYISKIRNAKTQENITIVPTAKPVAEEKKVEEKKVEVEVSRIQVDTKPTVSFSDEDQDDAIWQEARNTDTVAAYYNYLNNANTKKYRDDAKKRISTLNEMDKLNEQREWEHATTLDTVDAYKQYLKKYPFGNYYAKARFRITKLESEMQA
jgi:hypothetical protein